jgi:hypothetical protein
LVHFYMDNCPPCDKMDRYVFTDPDVIAFVHKHFVPVRVNGPMIPAQERARWKLSGYPTDFVVRADWKKAKRFTLTVNPHSYLKMMKECLEWTKQRMEQSVIRQTSYDPAPVYYESQVPVYYEPAPPIFYGPPQPMFYGGGECANGNCSGW